MLLKFKMYTTQKETKEIYDYNYNLANSIQNYKEITDYINDLADLSRMGQELILLSLKKYLIRTSEYLPKELELNFSSFFSPLKFILSVLKKCLINKNKRSKVPVDIIIDDWYNKSYETFYGIDLITGIQKTGKLLIAKYNNLQFITIIHLLRYIRSYFKTYLITLKLNKIFQINFTNFNYSFFIEFLIGLSIKDHLAPKLIISGNDNGFRIIHGKSTGAVIMLIQNGIRPYCGDSSFLYADYYISMWGKKFNQFSKNMGCHFKKMFYFGSIRLCNYINNHKIGTPEFDILYVSDWDCLPTDDWGYFSSYKNQLITIKLISDFARNTDLKIAYRCRGLQEIEQLKERGLYADSIHYFEFTQCSIYELIMNSKMVISSCSTSVWESIGVGKKGGYIYITENPYVTSYAQGLDIVYDSGSKISITEFIKKLNDNNKNYIDYAYQNPHYIQDTLSIIDKVVNNDR